MFTNLGALQRTVLCKNETSFQPSFYCHLNDKDPGAKIDIDFFSFKYETTIKSLLVQTAKLKNTQKRLVEYLICNIPN